jgi:hypothetical protein
MKAILLLLAVVVLPFSAGSDLQAQTLDDITRSLGSGNTAALTAVMDSEVQLSILGEENVLSRDKATSKLATFFSANAPSGFNQVHQGSSKSDAAEYCIGNLTTSNGVYRVYIYVANKGGKSVLQELRFDRE